MDGWASPWHILIVAIVLVVLFGSKRLPDAARSLGRSMRILKSEVRGMHEDEQQPSTGQPAQPQPAQAQPAQLPPAGAAPPPAAPISPTQPVGDRTDTP
jgi:sec-independent protein translocase protein TatA